MDDDSLRVSSNLLDAFLYDPVTTFLDDANIHFQYIQLAISNIVQNKIIYIPFQTQNI